MEAALGLDFAKLVECLLELAGEPLRVHAEGAVGVDDVEVDGRLLGGRVGRAVEEGGFERGNHRASGRSSVNNCKTRFRLSQLMRLQKRMNLANRQRDSILRFFPREQAHFGLGREHRALHGDGVWVRGHLVRQHQDWILATPHEIARDGKHEVGIRFEHISHKLVGCLQRDLGALGN
jgi:hypothetical protein